MEDVHWVDQATEALLNFMTDSIPTSRVLCLLTSRPGYASPIGERTYYTRIALPTLSTTDTVQMAHAMLATEQLPEALQGLILQKAEEIPSFSKKSSSPYRTSGPYGGRGSTMC